jgi:DNA replication protein DnaC
MTYSRTWDYLIIQIHEETHIIIKQIIKKMEQIETLMQQLRLTGMKNHWDSMQQTRQVHELSLLDGLSILLQSEKESKDNSRFHRLVANARFRYQASIEELKYDASRGLNKDQIAQLATGQYLNHGEPVLITGATGCGKSFLATALGYHGCAQDKKVLYFNIQKLFTRTKLARVEGTHIKLFDKIAKADLLIIDDFGLQKLESRQQQDFMEIIEDRHARKSTIIVSQLPVGAWHQIIGEDTIADAILDRLVHSSHRIELSGESLRKKQ